MYRTFSLSLIIITLPFTQRFMQNEVFDEVIVQVLHESLVDCRT